MLTRVALTTLAVLCLFPAAAFAEDSDVIVEDKVRDIGVLAGVNQLLVDGANVQLEMAYDRFVFDYSHGWSLDLPPVGADSDQKIALHLPYTTGFGLGYRFTRAFDLRFEPKLHKFDVHYEGDEGDEIVSYHTVTLGLGAYYSYRPFEHSDSFAKGITLASSVRYWPNVWSSLDNDEHSYQNKATGKREVHETANIGFFNTPVIVNVSVGYVFAL